MLILELRAEMKMIELKTIYLIILRNPMVGKKMVAMRTILLATLIILIIEMKVAIRVILITMMAILKCAFPVDATNLETSNPWMHIEIVLITICRLEKIMQARVMDSTTRVDLNLVELLVVVTQMVID